MDAIFAVSHMLAHPEHFPNKIFRLAGVSPLTVCIDWMHTKYLGTDQYFLGGVLFMIVNILMPGGTPDANCAELWELVKAEYRTRRTPTRFRILKCSMFNSGSGGYPKLKGKAHAIRHLGYSLKDIFEALAPHDDAFCTAVLGALRTGVQMEEILDVYKFQFKFPPDVAQTFVE